MNRWVRCTTVYLDEAVNCLISPEELFKLCANVEILNGIFYENMKLPLFNAILFIPAVHNCW